jgi:orotidine-5'-phosphate decarboxylase
MSTSKVIIPLDGLSEVQSLELATKLAGMVWGFKVNDLLLYSGVKIISELKKFGKVFADAKLHDIPNTVGNGVKRLAEAGADLITVHASGGLVQLEAAMKNAGHAQILAITLLTSMTEQDAKRIYASSTKETVIKLAKLASDAKVSGIVCSPEELPALANESFAKTLIKVTPGIRPSWYKAKDDQSRILTPAAAICAGADLLVVGRPITGHVDPVEAAKLVNQEVLEAI